MDPEWKGFFVCLCLFLFTVIVSACKRKGLKALAKPGHYTDKQRWAELKSEALKIWAEVWTISWDFSKQSMGIKCNWAKQLWIGNILIMVSDPAIWSAETFAPAWSYVEASGFFSRCKHLCRPYCRIWAIIRMLPIHNCLAWLHWSVY